MSFIVDAWFERTELRLGILDTESNKIILQWSLKRVATPGDDTPPLLDRKRRAGHCLQWVATPGDDTPPLLGARKPLKAHKLFLIACAESLLLREADRTELNKAL